MGTIDFKGFLGSLNFANCMDDVKKMEDEYHESLKLARVERVIEMIGKRYEVEALEGYKGPNSAFIGEVVNSLPEFLNAGKSLFLTGARGAGKTLAAWHIAKRAAELARGVKYYTMQRLLLKIFDDREVAEKCKSCTLLILDEVGKTVGNEKSGWELSRVLDILDTRHANKKSTILISNIPDTELTRFIGADMLDRMKEDDWRRVVYSGQSFRGEK